MDAARDESRERKAAGAQSTHVCSQQQTERYSRRPDHHLKQLEPNDFVDKRCTAAAGKQQKKQCKGRQWLFAMGFLRFRSHQSFRCDFTTSRGAATECSPERKPGVGVVFGTPAP